MSIRRAHMSTYPPRHEVMLRALKSLESQVDEIHLVLNEYRELPKSLSCIRNLRPHLPTQDYKDTGKFLFEVSPDDRVFLVDDDLLYSPGYCEHVERHSKKIGWEKRVFGIHGSIYGTRKSQGNYRRRLFHYSKPLRTSVCVDQLGTGTVFTLGTNLPPFEYMRSSQRAVDIRYARWCYENGIEQISLARPRHLIRSLHHGGETIYKTATSNPTQYLTDEIEQFAGRARNIGSLCGQRMGFLECYFSS